MKRSALALGVAVVVVIVIRGHAAAQRWQDATARCVGTTAQWSNKVEVADVDGDGLPDILVANGGNYSAPGTPEPTRVWRNLGTWSAATACAEISDQAVLGFTGLARAIKAADVDGDGDLDLVTGGAYQTQLALYLRDGTAWTDATDRLPQQPTSAGDLELGDVDGDGDLDLLIADWGALPPGSPMYVGGRTRLYINDGSGRFTDETAARMPDLLVGWSWDAELADLDGDWDLDALVSCKSCARNFVFRNAGGTFTDDPAALPAFTNNYEFEPMDIDADGDLDLMTLNNAQGLRDRLLVNDGAGGFRDETATRLPGTANPAADDNVAVWLDVDADGDPDLLVGSLSGADRLCLNDGRGVFALAPGATPNDTPGTLGVALADLDRDGRLDVVQAQGEAAFAEKVQLATAQVAIDAAPPVIARHARLGDAVVARIHDRISPVHDHDFERVWIATAAGDVAMRRYGEQLWRAAAVPPGDYTICARDARGNQACDPMPVAPDGAPDPVEAGVDPPVGGGGGGCCDAGGSPGAALVLLAAAALRGRRRRRRGQCQKPIDTARLR